jgi:translation initiation factor IF-1
LKITEKCVLCNGQIEYKYNPMENWKIDGHLCGKCYSKKISEHYPGEHVRVNLSDD